MTKYDQDQGAATHKGQSTVLDVESSRHTKTSSPFAAKRNLLCTVKVWQSHPLTLTPFLDNLWIMGPTTEVCNGDEEQHKEDQKKAFLRTFEHLPCSPAAFIIFYCLTTETTFWWLCPKAAHNHTGWHLPPKYAEHAKEIQRIFNSHQLPLIPLPLGNRRVNNAQKPPVEATYIFSRYRKVANTYKYLQKYQISHEV